MNMLRKPLNTNKYRFNMKFLNKPSEEFKKKLEKEAEIELAKIYEECGINKLLRAEFIELMVTGRKSQSTKEMVERFGYCLTGEEMKNIQKYI